jgi:hypothetical protein
MKLLDWLTLLTSRVPARAVQPRTTSERALSRRELLLVAAVLLVPIPLFATTGLNLPLLGPVERGVASLLPGGWEDTGTYEVSPVSGSIVLENSSAGEADLGGPVQPRTSGNQGSTGGGSGSEPSSPGSGGGAAEAPRSDPGTGSSSASGTIPSIQGPEPASSRGGSSEGGGNSSGGGGNGGGGGSEAPVGPAEVSIGVGGVGGVTVSGAVTGSETTPEVTGDVSVDTPVEGGDVTIEESAEVPDPEAAAGDLTGGSPSAASGGGTAGLPLNLPLDLPLPPNLP